MTGWRIRSHISTRPGKPCRIQPAAGFRSPVEPLCPPLYRCLQSRRTCCGMPEHLRPSDPSCSPLPDSAVPAAVRCRGSHRSASRGPRNTCPLLRCGPGGIGTHQPNRNNWRSSSTVRPRTVPKFNVIIVSPPYPIRIFRVGSRLLVFAPPQCKGARFNRQAVLPAEPKTSRYRAFGSGHGAVSQNLLWSIPCQLALVDAVDQEAPQQPRHPWRRAGLQLPSCARYR